MLPASLSTYSSIYPPSHTLPTFSPSYFPTCDFSFSLYLTLPHIFLPSDSQPLLELPLPITTTLPSLINSPSTYILPTLSPHSHYLSFFIPSSLPPTLPRPTPSHTPSTYPPNSPFYLRTLPSTYASVPCLHDISSQAALILVNFWDISPSSRGGLQRTPWWLIGRWMGQGGTALCLWSVAVACSVVGL